MLDDPSVGWEDIARKFATIRSDAGTDVVKRWSKHIRPAGTIVDIGCGTGEPISTALAAEGFDVYGIDPSPTMLAAFRRNLPGGQTACEAAENSRFFDLRFDGAVAVGVMFLLPEKSQFAVIERVAKALQPGGHFLFSAPRQLCQWNDTLTGRLSLSLGEERYRRLLAGAGCHLVDGYLDDGSNYYFHAVSASE